MNGVLLRLSLSLLLSASAICGCARNDSIAGRPAARSVTKYTPPNHTGNRAAIERAVFDEFLEQFRKAQKNMTGLTVLTSPQNESTIQGKLKHYRSERSSGGGMAKRTLVVKTILLQGEDYEEDPYKRGFVAIARLLNIEENAVITHVYGLHQVGDLWQPHDLFGGLVD